MSTQPLVFGPFTLDPDRGTLLRDSEPVALGRRGILLLDALLKRPGEIFTKTELMDAGWQGSAVEESNLSVQIALLRKALGPMPGGGTGSPPFRASATASSAQAPTRRAGRFRTRRSRRWRSFPSPASAAIPNRNTSPTGWRKTS